MGQDEEQRKKLEEWDAKVARKDPMAARLEFTAAAPRGLLGPDGRLKADEARLQELSSTVYRLMRDGLGNKNSLLPEAELEEISVLRDRVAAQKKAEQDETPEEEKVHTRWSVSRFRGCFSNSCFNFGVFLFLIFICLYNYDRRAAFTTS